jgi:hypothetical protein
MSGMGDRGTILKSVVITQIILKLFWSFSEISIRKISKVKKLEKLQKFKKALFIPILPIPS